MIVITSGIEVWYGAGESWKSMTIPNASAMSPESVSAPCVGDVRSTTSSATPSRTSPSPVHEIGSTEKPNSAVSSETAPKRARQHDAGWKISNPIPAIPARKSSVTMFGSISVVRNRVKNPG